MSARTLLAPLVLIALAGCRHAGEIDETGGITAIRTPCPTVGVPAGTGDITLFNSGARTSDAIDLTATLTDVRSTCDNGDVNVNTAVTFDVLARRAQTDDARDVTLPYFISVVQGGTAVIAKKIGSVTVHFAAGQARAIAHGHAIGTVLRSEATLPPEVRDRLTEKRKAGEQDAAIDPLSQPEVRQAVSRATFETLVGFQLTEDQLKYNVTR